MKFILPFDYFALTVYTFTFLLGLPANVLVFSVYVRKARKHGVTPNVVYTINLCVSNFFLIAWMPVKSAETILQFWMLPELLCPIYSFFVVASLYGSGLLLTAVAVGRYLSIAFPIIYNRYRCARTSCMISAILWAIVLLHLSSALMAEQGAYFVSSNANKSKCYENFTREQLNVLLPLRLEMSVFLFIIPLLISVFCTLRCLTLIRRSCLSAGSKRRVLAMELSALIVFVVCYAPYNVSHVAGFVQNENIKWRNEAIMTSCCNVFLEPVVMLLLSPSGSRILLWGLCRKQINEHHHQRIVNVMNPLFITQSGLLSFKKQLVS